MKTNLPTERCSITPISDWYRKLDDEELDGPKIARALELIPLGSVFARTATELAADPNKEYTKEGRVAKINGQSSENK